MTRNHNKVEYTEKDAKNLTVKTFSDDEIQDNIRTKKRKMTKIRLLLFVLSGISFMLMYATKNSDSIIITSLFLIILIFIWIVCEFAWKQNRRYYTSKYYIEFRIKEKLETENYIEQSNSEGSYLSVFYPVIGVDTTSGYETKIYVKDWKTHNKEVGTIVRQSLYSPDVNSNTNP